MKKAKPNLVAGRLSHPLAASGKSTYEKTRLGLAAPEQPTPEQPTDDAVDTLPHADVPPELPIAELPPVELPIAELSPVELPHTELPPADMMPPQPTRNTLGAVLREDTRDAAPRTTIQMEVPCPAPWDLPAAPDDGTDTTPDLQPWELPAASIDDETPGTPTLQPWELPAASIEPELETSSAPAPSPWALPAASTHTETSNVAEKPATKAAPKPADPAPLVTSMPLNNQVDLRAQVRAQAIQAWNAQQQPAAETAAMAPAQFKCGVSAMQIVKLVWPALGGLVLLAIMYGLWLWVNGGSVPSLFPGKANAKTPTPPSKQSSPPQGKSRNASLMPQTPVEPVPVDNDDVEPTTTELKLPKNFLEGDITIEFPPEPILPPVKATSAKTTVDPPVTTKPAGPVMVDPPPHLKLVTIGHLPKGLAASINGKLRYVGDEIEDAKIISIGKFSVDMELPNGNRFRLHLGKGEDPSDEDAPPAPTPTTAPAK